MLKDIFYMAILKFVIGEYENTPFFKLLKK